MEEKQSKNLTLIAPSTFKSNQNEKLSVFNSQIFVIVKTITGTNVILIINNIIDFSKNFPISGKADSREGVVLMKDKLNGKGLDVFVAQKLFL